MSNTMLQPIQKIGLGIFVFCLLTFLSTLFIGEYKLTPEVLEKTDAARAEAFQEVLTPMMNKSYSSSFAFVSDLWSYTAEKNQQFVQEQQWHLIIQTYFWNGADGFTLNLTKNAATGLVRDNAWLFFTIIFVFSSLGALLFIGPKFKEGTAGIKHNNIFFSKVNNRGWIGIALGVLMILFYVALYWFPYYIVNLVILVDPIAIALSGSPASQWFLYGFIYTIAILVMGVRFLSKYRHSKYQQWRTASVMFFQLSFAFIIGNILMHLNLPYQDLKNIWPLDYTFFAGYHIKELVENGTLGYFMLFWGIILTVIGVPVMVYFFGKRWYCSWVCGCGGLAETAGDPFRQLSDKSLKAWNIERYLIHFVLVFAIIMTIGTIYTYFTDDYNLLGVIPTESVKAWYGFFIGATFSGVVGTGFYPLMGNRVWCRFGCPLAAYLGLVQRFQSRFRITTNGGQCISCGNCSTYCEMGIDVRWYAQRGQNIVRSSCVGCGICSAVCPRGVLNLENGPTEGRINDNPILIGNDGVKVTA